MHYLIYVQGIAAACAAACVLAAPMPTPQDLPTDLTREQIRQTGGLNHVGSEGENNTQRSLSLSEQEILQQPDLLVNALDTAVARYHVEHIRFLLGIYRKLPPEQQNSQLIQYAQAILYRADGQHDQAEALLQALLAEHPEYAPVRLQLAMTQAENGQWLEAEQQLQEIHKTPDLPEYVADYVRQAERQLQQKRKWKWDAHVSYLQDDNVGRAPQQRNYAGWRFSEPQSAHGVNYALSAQKTIPLKGHWAARAQASVSGKFYWDAHDYDDLIVHTEVGGVWRNAKREISLSPFYDKRWFATEPYSQTTGATLRYSHMFSPKTSAFFAWQSAYKKHDARTYLDGSTHMASVTVLHRPSSKQSFTLGLSGGQSNARDLSEAYVHGNVHGGWTQQWGKRGSWTTALNAGAQRRHYRAADFFNIRRRDTEYWTHLSLSNQKWSWHGFVPRLNWTWSHVQSNHFYYRYNQHRVFFDVSKQF